MNMAIQDFSSAFNLYACVQCGTPLLEPEGFRAFISGTQELFCRRECVGQYRQQQTIAFR